MQVKANAHKGLSYSYSVTVPAAALEEQMATELKAYGQRAKIPGFRPGKIPLAVLKQRFSKDVMGEVLQRSINKATREVIDNNKLRPAMAPEVKITEFKEGGDLQFDMELEVIPDVPKIAYEKFTVDDYRCEVAENKVEESLARLAATRRHLHKEEGAAKLGSVVKIDFVGKIDGEAFSGGAAKGHMLELGAGQFIPGFEEQLVGAKPGDEVAVKVDFPKDYHSEALAGKPAVFDVTVHEVHRVHVPEVNEQLASGFGFEDLQALKKAVATQMAEELARAARDRSKKQLFDLLDEKVSFDVPSRMVKAEFDTIWKQIEEARARGDKSLTEKSEADLRKEYEKIAERRVRLGIVLSEIGRAEKLEITREEVSAAVMQQARAFPGQEEKIFEFYRKNPQQVDELRGPILEEKAVDWILGKVKRVEKKIAMEELLAPDEEEEDASAEDKKAKKSAKKK
jgi:trigger factor